VVEYRHTIDGIDEGWLEGPFFVGWPNPPSPATHLRILRAADERVVAVSDGRVVGFIMGNVYLGEFGIPETTASLDTIGVHPEYQKQGIATQLMEEFITHVRAAGVDTVYTLVNWNDWALLRFFEAVGFAPAPTVNLELKIRR
jgi:ribosomal protein S18 acetylase RimI-like enzyme